MDYRSEACIILTKYGYRDDCPMQIDPMIMIAMALGVVGLVLILRRLK